jgi:hypothetical protein
MKTMPSKVQLQALFVFASPNMTLENHLSSALIAKGYSISSVWNHPMVEMVFLVVNLALILFRILEIALRNRSQKKGHVLHHQSTRLGRNPKQRFQDFQVGQGHKLQSQRMMIQIKVVHRCTKLQVSINLLLEPLIYLQRNL